jgi:hypothetical protein
LVIELLSSVKVVRVLGFPARVDIKRLPLEIQIAYCRIVRELPLGAGHPSGQNVIREEMQFKESSWAATKTYKFCLLTI